MNISLFSYRPAAHAALMSLLALLAGCGGGYGSGGMTKPPTNVTISGAILPTLATMTTIGSTLDPTEHGGNPYGLTVATATAGLITMGDLIVCNFNDGATNTQGLGTTVVGLHPTAGAMPYRIAQSTPLLGCSSVTSLPDGSIVATASQAQATVLIAPGGAMSTPFSTDVFAEPWSAIYATHGGSEAVYVSNATTGAMRTSMGSFSWRWGPACSANLNLCSSSGSSTATTRVWGTTKTCWWAAITMRTTGSSCKAPAVRGMRRSYAAACPTSWKCAAENTSSCPVSRLCD